MDESNVISFRLCFSVGNYSVATTESGFLYTFVGSDFAPYVMGLKGNWRNVSVLHLILQDLHILFYIRKRSSHHFHLIADNWSSELARWCPALNVSKYYGHPEDRRQLRIQYARGLENIDVVLTT